MMSLALNEHYKDDGAIIFKQCRSRSSPANLRLGSSIGSLRMSSLALSDRADEGLPPSIKL
jgi:hypothetical protein